MHDVEVPFVSAFFFLFFALYFISRHQLVFVEQDTHKDLKLAPWSLTFCFICYPYRSRSTHAWGTPGGKKKKKKKRKTARLEKLDPNVVWTPSSSSRPHGQKWMDFFWTGRKGSYHCHLFHAVSDAAIWTWGWGINLHPRAGLDILFPDGAPPLLWTLPQRALASQRVPSITGEPGPLILGAEAPLGSTCPRVFTLVAKTTPPHPSALHPPLLPRGVRGRLRVWDNFACPETLFWDDIHTQVRG